MHSYTHTLKCIIHSEMKLVQKHEVPTDESDSPGKLSLRQCFSWTPAPHWADGRLWVSPTEVGPNTIIATRISFLGRGQMFPWCWRQFGSSEWLWCVCTKSSAHRSILGHQTFARRRLFITLIPGWPSCASCNVRSLNDSGITIFVPRGKISPAKHNSVANGLSNAKFSTFFHSMLSLPIEFLRRLPKLFQFLLI